MTDLRTHRLRLEALRAKHAANVFEAMQDPSIYTFLPEDPPSAEALAKRYAFLAVGKSPDGQEHWLNWIAFLEGSQTPVGTFQATVPKASEAAIAYIVFPPFWRQGYAREMASVVIPHLFSSYEAPSLYAEIDTRNIGSIALVESLGFSLVETTQDADFFKGSSSDEHRYAVTPAAWPRGKVERIP